jgi:AcrR family transcriptional regulator
MFCTTWYRSAVATKNARTDLLDRAVEHVSAHGLGDSSLRAIAAQLGTSHRMLIYHFGSAERFWDAVMARTRKRDRRALSEAAASGEVPLLEATWASLSSARNLPFARLMFETYGRALRDRKRFQPFLSQVVDGWIESVSDALEQQFRVGPQRARVEARLRLAVLRGLLLDLLTTGDREGTTEALESFAKRMRLQRRRTQSRSR